MKKMIDYLNAHEGYHLDEMQNLIYKIYDEFVDIYDALIPALVLQYCKDDAFNLNLEGSTTSTFDMVKQFYLKALYFQAWKMQFLPIFFG